MNALDKPREIKVTSKVIGVAPWERDGLSARDTHTGAVLTVPRPVKRNGNEVTGREAAQHIASLLLLAQGDGGLRSVWDRSTENMDAFTVFGD